VVNPYRRFDEMLNPKTQKTALAALLLVGIMVWLVALLLLLEVTRQLLDTVRFIVELAQMS
jgi:hypothetical protein